MKSRQAHNARARIERRFKPQKSKSEFVAGNESVAEDDESLVALLEENFMELDELYDSIGQSQDMDQAKARLHEAVMWATKAIIYND